MDTIDNELFEILACPKCKSSLIYSDDKQHLICTKCKSKYNIQEGIPILLTEDE